jgi:Bacterial Ig-like domain (group 3)
VGPAAAGPALAPPAPPPGNVPPQVSRPVEAQYYFYQVRNPVPCGQGQAPPVASAASLPVSPATVGGSWSPLGPASSTAGAVPGGGQVSGRVDSIAADPKNPNTIYAGTSSGGVWKTANAGVSWVPLSYGQPSLSTGAVLVNPQNSLNVFAGTGDIFKGGNQGATPPYSYLGAGLLSSMDGGNTWTAIGGNAFNNAAITDLAMSPDGTRLFATASNGFYVGTLAAGSWNFVRRGTGTWYSVRVNLGNPDIVNLGAFSGPWIYRVGSDNLDVSALSGTMAAPSDIGYTIIAVDPVNPARVYASMQCFTNSGVCPKVDGAFVGWWGVFQSIDSGSTFKPLVAPPKPPVPTNGGYEFSQANYDLSLAVDPLNNCFIYFGLVSLWNYQLAGSGCNGPATTNISSPGVAQSDISCYPSNSSRFTVAQGVHCDQHAIAFDSAGTFYAGNDGGIYASPPNSHGAMWNDLNANISSIEFYPGVSFNPSNPGVLFGGSQDNGTDSTVGGNWQVSAGGDGTYTAFDPRNPASAWYGEYVNLQIYKTANGNAAWSAASGPIWNLVINGMVTDSQGVVGSLFAAPFALDINNPNDLLAGADRPYLTTNGAGVWNDISGNLPDPLNDQISATAFCTTPSNAGIFYIGTLKGSIYLTTNGLSAAPSWVQVSAGLPGQFVTRIVCPAGSPNVYATIGGGPTGAKHMFVNTQAGTGVWTSIQGNLPDTTVSSLLADTRSSPATLYTSTDLGVFVSADSGTTWNQLGTGMPRVIVQDLQLDPVRNVLMAATWGSGWWSIPLLGKPTGPLPQSPPSSAPGVSLTSSNNPSNLGAGVTFMAAVGCPGFTATGSITFSDGTTTLTTVQLIGGTATFTTTALLIGPHKIIASYSGDVNCTPATGALLQTVNAAGTGLASGSGAPATSTPGSLPGAAKCLAAFSDPAQQQACATQSQIGSGGAPPGGPAPGFTPGRDCTTNAGSLTWIPLGRPVPGGVTCST